MAEIKICGLKFPEDVEAVNLYEPEYIGMVMFCPKSARNVSPETAQELLKKIKPNIKKVAVVVSPDLEQIQIIEKIGFDFIQIHGEIKDEIFENVKLPVIRAVNVSQNSFDEIYKKLLEKVLKWNRIHGVLFDAGTPGSGQTFQWDEIEQIKNNVQEAGVKLFLAGGLNPENVSDAITHVQPDVVDVSSGVEYSEKPSGSGKDAKKVADFIANVRNEI
jgi:phosphoribosylanthranilate isomerase